MSRETHTSVDASAAQPASPSPATFALTPRPSRAPIRVCVLDAPGSQRPRVVVSSAAPRPCAVDPSALPQLAAPAGLDIAASARACGPRVAAAAS